MMKDHRQPMDSDQRRRHRQTVTISTLSSVIGICVVILPAAAWFGKGTVINLLSDAMAGEIQQQVRHQVAPVNAGLKALIQNNIAELEDEIADLEYRQQHDAEWSAGDARTLATKRRRLSAQREALSAIKAAESD